MWCASLDSPTPRSKIALSGNSAGKRWSRMKAAPSPIEIPLRLAAYGWHGALDSTSSELKPHSVVRHRESTPPTTTASTRPASIIRQAEAKTLPLDEQADDTEAAGPDKFR